MANSELLNKEYKIPYDILKFIKSVFISNPNGEGVKRAKFMLKNGKITYQVLKRLKNYFDNYNSETGNKIQYNLAGGNLMKSFVDKTLQSDRDAVNRSKKIKKDINVNPNLGVKAYQSTLLRESNFLNKKVIIIIVNNDNKFLLGKRSSDSDWMPEKWALIGGGIEKNETPTNAIIREIKEEIGLEIKTPLKRFEIKRDDNNEIIFVVKYDGDDIEVNLNNEHSNYGWFTIEEIKFLDTVPNIENYIKIAFKEYN